MIGIIVRTQFEAIHRYPDAPEPVNYLKEYHRHMFHVEAEIETFHDDRELEFIMVKHSIDKYTSNSQNVGCQSCEQIAKRISAFLKSSYPIKKKLFIEDSEDVYDRKVNVRVFEDLENGAFIKEF